MKILKVRAERLLVLLYLPLGLISILKANTDFLLTSIMMQTLLITSLYYGIRETRKTLIEEIKAGIYAEDLEEIKEAIASIKKTIATALKGTKKEVIGSNLKTTKLKDAF